MHYLLWHTTTGKNKTAQVSFMHDSWTLNFHQIDLSFGISKRKYRCTFISTLDEMQDVR